MKNALIIHGTEGYPQENWFPWLKEKLEKQGYEVFVPQFPTPKNQDPEHWFETIEDLMPLFNEETIIVGHSCGGTFLLKILEQLKIRINVAVIVASSVGIPPVKYEHVDAPFLKTPLDWEKIRAATRHSIVFHSEDDPYICIENGIEIAEKFGTELQRSVDAGHFNEKAGFTTFEELWGKLRPFL